MANYEPKTPENMCPFCEIAAGRMQTPGFFWQNDEFVAFLSIDPNTEGFSCVVPKAHYGSDVLKMPSDALARFMVAAQEVAGILEKHFSDVGRVGAIMEGTGIDHAHIKLVPMHGTEVLKDGGWKQFASGKEFWFDTYEGWLSSAGGPRADMEKLAALARELEKM